MREYHRWRAVTAQLISSKSDGFKTDAHLNQIIDTTFSRIRSFMSDKGLKRGVDECLSTLDQIFEHAVQMDLDMNKQFASYYLKIPHSSDRPPVPYGFHFNPRCMEAGSSQECDVVGLVVTPMLLSVGDRNGKGFLKSPDVLEPCSVMPLGAFERRLRRSDGREHKDNRKRPESQKPRNGRRALW